MSTKVRISKRLVLINSASSIAERVVNITIVVWLNQYLLRRISTEEYSLYPLIMAVMVFMPLLTTILTSGIGRYIVEAYAVGDEHRVTQIVSTMLPLLVAAGAAVLVLGGSLAWYVDRVLDVAAHRIWDARIMLGLLVSAAAIQLPLAPLGVGLYVQQRFVLTNIINVSMSFLRILLLLAFLFGVSTRVLWVVVASVVAQFCGLIVRVVISRRLVPAVRFRLSAIRWSLARTLTSFGVWNFILSAADAIRTSADVIILNKLAMPLDVANFHLGSLALRNIQSGSYIVRAPLQPSLTAMYSTGQGQRLAGAYLRGGRYALWVSLFMALPLMIYRNEVIRLYAGEKYLAAGTVMALLLLATFPIGYGNVMLSHLAIAKARLRTWALCACAMQSGNLALTLYFVGVAHMGARGSALATFIVGALGHPFLLCPLGLRLAGVHWRAWLRETLLPGFLPGLAGAAAWLSLQMLLHPSSWASLGGCVGCGWLVYLGGLFVFALRPIDKVELSRVVAKLRILRPTVRTSV